MASGQLCSFMISEASSTMNSCNSSQPTVLLPFPYASVWDESSKRKSIKLKVRSRLMEGKTEKPNKMNRIFLKVRTRAKTQLKRKEEKYVPALWLDLAWLGSWTNVEAAISYREDRQASQSIWMNEWRNECINVLELIWMENGKSKTKLNKNEKKSIKCDVLLTRNKIFICLCRWKVIPTALHRILCACWWRAWSDGVSPWLLVSSLTPDFEFFLSPAAQTIHSYSYQHQHHHLLCNSSLFLYFMYVQENVDLMDYPFLMLFFNFISFNFVQ